MKPSSSSDALLKEAVAILRATPAAPGEDVLIEWIQESITIAKGKDANAVRSRNNALIAKRVREAAKSLMDALVEVHSTIPTLAETQIHADQMKAIRIEGNARLETDILAAEIACDQPRLNVLLIAKAIGEKNDQLLSRLSPPSLEVMQRGFSPITLPIRDPDGFMRELDCLVRKCRVKTDKKVYGESISPGRSRLEAGVLACHMAAAHLLTCCMADPEVKSGGNVARLGACLCHLAGFRLPKGESTRATRLACNVEELRDYLYAPYDITQDSMLKLPVEFKHGKQGL